MAKLDYEIYSPLGSGMSTPPCTRLATPKNPVTISAPTTPPKSSFLLPQQIQTSISDVSHHQKIWLTASSNISISQHASNISILSFSKHNNASLLSQSDACINICKCFTGASLFAIPWALKQSGMLLGLVSLLCLAVMTYYTLYWLAECGHMHPSMTHPTYPDIAYTALGSSGFYISWIAILCMTIGVCSSYLVFIGSQTQHLLPSNTLNQNEIILIVGVPMILLSLLRSYRLLVPFNILGLISLVCAVVIVCLEAATNIEQHNATKHYYYYNKNLANYPLFLGNAAFAFLIHSVILPIEQSMRDRSDKTVSREYTKALRFALVFVTVLFACFAALAYYAFGDAVCGNIMNNLDSDEWYSKLVIVSLCLNLFFTYPLFLFPMVECLEMSLLKKNRWIQMQRNGLRICLVLLTCAISVVIPDFEKLTGLTGAFGNNVLGLILPPVMYFRLLQQSHNTAHVKLSDKLTGLTGAFGNNVLGLILPPVMYFRLLQQSHNNAHVKLSDKLTGLTGAFGNNVLGLILPPVMYFRLLQQSHN
eukprot:556281_1